MQRKTKKPVEISSLLKSSSGTLAQISQKSNFLKKIAHIVRQICPDLPEETWHIANIKDNIVVIEVISSIWGQRFQFEKNTIAQALASKTNNQYNQVQLKVNPYFNRKESPIQPTEDKPKKHMSQSSAKQLQEVAENAPKCLQEKLLKLASHANQGK